jgi:hypothetical protein
MLMPAVFCQCHAHAGGETIHVHHDADNHSTDDETSGQGSGFPHHHAPDCPTLTISVGISALPPVIGVMPHVATLEISEAPDAEGQFCVLPADPSPKPSRLYVTLCALRN